ncbi:peptidase M24A, methionine aminopeptidase [Aspergillus campestris IBT 28561]|uniref:Methionine aminopeptidase 2 n=1 Tax=Aspergillus campestris (strain IBT 28561) TaxID=1392248 RepID=A0A2I1CXN6_ASPC2|nr:peptidase M24A, methionine aminopeptidase [Aspergillus campestris IBT 28561]PKY02387.1 peptidase M24A, methionine aminopeptidase [Aspergillus campestris IBT 28561]
MGSKSPEHQDTPHGHNAPSAAVTTTGGEPRGAHLSRDGDGSLGDGGDTDDDDDDDDDTLGAGAVPHSLTGSTATKKNQNKKKKKKKSKKKPSGPVHQSSPPRVPVDQLFPTGQYPMGEIQCDGAVMNTARTTAAESRDQARCDLVDETFLNNYRKAGEIHRQVRQWVQASVRPGQNLMDIAVGIDDGVRALLDNAGLAPGEGLRSGLGFPTGLSLNHCVAHSTPNPGQPPVVLQATDVMKVDFGVHINGWIVDSAFTMSFDPTYDPLLAAVQDATNTGIRTAGVDVRISDVSAAIQEVMESYEVEIRGHTFPVKPVRSLSGHDIKQYQIHGGKSIPFVRNNDQTKMEAGEIFAIETFGSTGRGTVIDGAGVYGYGRSADAPLKVITPLATARSLYKSINENFGSLVFSRHSLERLGVDRYLAGMNNLVSKGVMDVYPPLMDVRGSFSAQFEHTIILGESGKEVISRGDDY